MFSEHHTFLCSELYMYVWIRPYTTRLMYLTIVPDSLMKNSERRSVFYMLVDTLIDQNDQNKRSEQSSKLFYPTKDPTTSEE